MIPMMIQVMRPVLILAAPTMVVVLTARGSLQGTTDGGESWKARN